MAVLLNHEDDGDDVGDDGGDDDDDDVSDADSNHNNKQKIGILLQYYDVRIKCMMMVETTTTIL